MEVHLDYLRLGSWDIGLYAKFVARFMRDNPGEWKQSGWLQYRGWGKKSLFIGQGEQKRKAHMIINISGAAAQEHYRQFVDIGELYCTRIDLQVTRPLPAKYTGLRVIRQACTSTNNTLIESRDNDTLYIGSRSSELFVRLYEKVLDEKYLRLEFELKGGRARQAWLAIRDGEDLRSIYNYYVKRSRLPWGTQQHYLYNSISATSRAMVAETTISAKHRLEWIINLDASMMKAMGDHTIGEQTKTIVRAWARYADKLDRDASDVVE